MRAWVVFVSMKVFAYLYPVSLSVLAFNVLVFPFAFWKKTKKLTAICLFCSSIFFGITLWFLCTGITFTVFGWIGLIVGLLFVGLGVVPLGFIGAFFYLDIQGLVLAMFILLLITYVFRMIGAVLLEQCYIDRVPPWNGLLDYSDPIVPTVSDDVLEDDLEDLVDNLDDKLNDLEGKADDVDFEVDNDLDDANDNLRDLANDMELLLIDLDCQDDQNELDEIQKGLDEIEKGLNDMDKDK